MGHDKLKRFKENEGFKCLLQPASNEILNKGTKGLVLSDHPIKGRWNETFFHNSSPIVLELGCGKGEYTVDLSSRNKDCNYVGIDIKGARMWKGAKFVTENNIPNVGFLRTRIEFIEAFFACGEISEIWLTFSDPQIKSENKRLTSPGFLNIYRKILKPGGIVHIKTDSMFLHKYSHATALANKLRVLACTDDLYGNSRDDLYSGAMASVCGKNSIDALFDVRTYYENKFLDRGLKITYLSFVIDHEGDFVSPSWDEDYWKESEKNR